MQQKVFKDVLQLPDDVISERFGYMLDAFKYGAPPHGGIALGFDRLVARVGNPFAFCRDYDEAARR